MMSAVSSATECLLRRWVTTDELFTLAPQLCTGQAKSAEGSLAGPKGSWALGVRRATVGLGRGCTEEVSLDGDGDEWLEYVPWVGVAVLISVVGKDTLRGTVLGWAVLGRSGPRAAWSGRLSLCGGEIESGLADKDGLGCSSCLDRTDPT